MGIVVGSFSSEQIWIVCIFVLLCACVCANAVVKAEGWMDTFMTSKHESLEKLIKYAHT